MSMGSINQVTPRVGYWVYRFFTIFNLHFWSLWHGGYNEFSPQEVINVFKLSTSRIMYRTRYQYFADNVFKLSTSRITFHYNKSTLVYFGSTKFKFRHTRCKTNYTTRFCFQHRIKNDNLFHFIRTFDIKLNVKVKLLQHLSFTQH